MSSQAHKKQVLLGAMCKSLLMTAEALSGRALNEEAAEEARRPMRLAWEMRIHGSAIFGRSAWPKYLAPACHMKCPSGEGSATHTGITSNIEGHCKLAASKLAQREAGQAAPSWLSGRPGSGCEQGSEGLEALLESSCWVLWQQRGLFKGLAATPWRVAPAFEQASGSWLPARG